MTGRHALPRQRTVGAAALLPARRSRGVHAAPRPPGGRRRAPRSRAAITDRVPVSWTRTVALSGAGVTALAVSLTVLGDERTPGYPSAEARQATAAQTLEPRGTAAERRVSRSAPVPRGTPDVASATPSAPGASSPDGGSVTSASGDAPTHGVPTPSVWTPSAPTPGTPAPSAPTPSAPAPGTPDPTAPAPTSSATQGPTQPAPASETQKPADKQEPKPTSGPLDGLTDALLETVGGALDGVAGLVP